MKTKLLTELDFNATFVAPMCDVSAETTNVIDIWPYVEAIPDEDLEGHSVFDRLVEYVYRNADKSCDHVLVMTKSKDVYLAVIIDLVKDAILGHYLLDLRNKYGLK